MNTLTERRKADRAAMAAQVKTLAEEMDATAQIVPRPFGEFSPQRIDVKIQAARGLSVTVHFNGQSSQPNTQVLSWHFESGRKSQLSPIFTPSVHPLHFHKATDIAEGFAALISLLKIRLESVRNGSAFQSATVQG